MKLRLSLSSTLSITETSFKKGPLWKGMRKTIISCISLPSLLLNGGTKCITSFRSFLWTIVWEKAPAATWIEWQFWLHCLSVRENKSENKSNDPIGYCISPKRVGFLLRFFLGSTIIMKRLHFLRWTCPLNYIRASLLSCANNSDSCFKETCQKRNALYNAHFIVTSSPTRPRQQIWLQNMTNKLMNHLSQLFISTSKT